MHTTLARVRILWIAYSYSCKWYKINMKIPILDTCLYPWSMNTLMYEFLPNSITCVEQAWHNNWKFPSPPSPAVVPITCPPHPLCQPVSPLQDSFQSSNISTKQWWPVTPIAVRNFLPPWSSYSVATGRPSWLLAQPASAPTNLMRSMVWTAWILHFPGIYR